MSGRVTPALLHWLKRAGWAGPGWQMGARGHHIATGPAVVAATRQGIEGFLAAHAHGHHLVPHLPGESWEGPAPRTAAVGQRVGTSGPLPTPLSPGPLCPPACGRESAAVLPSGSHMKGTERIKTTLGEVNLSTSCITSEGN